MDCEKIVHGSRDTMPFPKFFTMVDDPKKGPVKVPVKQENFPYKCLRDAEIVMVKGESFSCMAVLCKQHQRAAINEGFTLKKVEQ